VNGRRETARLRGHEKGILDVAYSPDGKTLATLGLDGTARLWDVAASRERFVGARALWRPQDVSELLVTFANPSAVGLSAVAGALCPLPRGGGRGLHVRLAPDAAGAERVVQVALAPGLVVQVPVAGHRVLALGDEAELAGDAGTVALDGEREIERRHRDPVRVRLLPGPLTIDVDAVMRNANAATPG